MTLISFGCCGSSSCFDVVRFGLTVALGFVLSSIRCDCSLDINVWAAETLFDVVWGGGVGLRAVVVTLAGILLTLITLFAALFIVSDAADFVSSRATVFELVAGLRCTRLPFWWWCDLLVEIAPANREVSWFVNGSGMITMGSSSIPPLLSLSVLEISLRFKGGPLGLAYLKKNLIFFKFKKKNIAAFFFLDAF